MARKGVETKTIIMAESIHGDRSAGMVERKGGGGKEEDV